MAQLHRVMSGVLQKPRAGNPLLSEAIIRESFARRREPLLGKPSLQARPSQAARKARIHSAEGKPYRRAKLGGSHKPERSDRNTLSRPHKPGNPRKPNKAKAFHKTRKLPINFTPIAILKYSERKSPGPLRGFGI
jgi:hypothetical protein